MRHTPKAQDIPYFLVLATATYIFGLSQIVPFFADDYCWSYPTFELQNIIDRTISRYNNAAGRLPSAILYYSLLSAGKIGLTLISLLTALSYTALALIALRLRPQRNWIEQTLLLAFFTYLFWFTPDTLGEDILWKTGAMTYFYGSVIAIACLQFTLKFILYEHTTQRRILLPLYTIGAFIGGMWLETLGIAIFIVWTSLLSYRHFIQQKSIPTIYWIGLLCWSVGLTILLIAPGNYARLATTAELNGNPDIFTKLEQLTPFILTNFGKKLIAIYLLLLITTITLRPKDLTKRLLHAHIFIATGVLTALTTLGSPTIVYWGRVTFPSELLYIIGTLTLFPITPRIIARLPLTFVALALTTLFLLDANTTYTTYQSINAQEQQRETIINQALAQGKTILKLPPLTFPNGQTTYPSEVNWGRNFARDISQNPTESRSRCYAHYHGLNSVSL